MWRRTRKCRGNRGLVAGCISWHHKTGFVFGRIIVSHCFLGMRPRSEQRGWSVASSFGVWGSTISFHFQVYQRFAVDWVRRIANLALTILLWKILRRRYFYFTTTMLLLRMLCVMDALQIRQRRQYLELAVKLNTRNKVECESSYFFLHPLNESIKIYWLFDAPHMLKCARNHILKHKEVQV